jgi:hypothetical protein
MAEYAEADPATAEQQGDSKKISFRFCREWYEHDMPVGMCL